MVSALFAATLREGAWVRHAAHANAMASRLSRGLGELGLAIPYQTQSNGVFVRITEAQRRALEARGHGFYMFGDPAWNLARLMCSFDTTEGDVDGLLADAREARTASLQPPC